MKKIYIFLLTVTFLFVALEAFTVETFAMSVLSVTAASDNDDSQLLEVNAVEYEDEGNDENPVDTSTDNEDDSDLISEADSEQIAAISEQAEIEQTSSNVTVNPSTGVEIPIVPMIIAGAIIVILLVVFWILKKKGYGNGKNNKKNGSKRR